MKKCLSLAFGLAAAIALPASAEVPATPPQPLSVALVAALNTIAGGPHSGFRANHAKGVMAFGHFEPSVAARTVSKAAHFQSGVPITVRFSNDSGRISFLDASRDARPHGVAVRFHLKDGNSTDIVTNTAKAFPVSTPEEFLAMLNAVIASGPGVAKPTPIDRFVKAHPTAQAYFDSFHPPPVSFGTMTYFGLNAFKFTNARGESRYVRYQLRPLAGEQYLSEEEGIKAHSDYLMDELPVRLAKAPLRFSLVAQIATPFDNVKDPAVAWPSDNPHVELGTIHIDKFVADPTVAKTILFNPVSLLPGIEPSADPVLALRFPAYAVSFGQRANGPVGAPSAMTPPPARETSGTSAELGRSRNCLNCHAATTRLVGPSFQDVAGKYANDQGAEARLVQKVLKGSSGAWGSIPMPANTHVSEAEARSLVRWVLLHK